MTFQGKRKSPRPGQVSLERALSKLGLASRTQARELIQRGEVTVDGQLIRHPGFKVVPERVKIEISGVRADAPAPFTIMLHKPRGVVTTLSDEKGRPTVYSLLKDIRVHLGPVGRLDLATTGLLILTNDTQFSNWLIDPANAVPRTYIATVRGNVTEAQVARISTQGVLDSGESLRPSSLEILKASNRETHLKIELLEGKNREIRRLFKASGFEVSRLKRVSFGGLALGDLAPGRWRELSSHELRGAFPRAPLKVRPAKLIKRENP